jgi:hypothetical protein
MRVILVGCSKRKQEGPQPYPAADLYTSPLFRASRAYAIQEVSQEAPGHACWAILSAKWGLLRPQAMVVPYQKPMTVMKAEAAEWAREVWREVESLAVDAARQAGRTHREITELGLALEVLAGRDYARPLVAGARARGPRVTLAEPLGGMMLGRRLQWLNRQLGRQPDPLRGCTRV